MVVGTAERLGALSVILTADLLAVVSAELTALCSDATKVWWKVVMWDIQRDSVMEIQMV